MNECTNPSKSAAVSCTGSVVTVSQPDERESMAKDPELVGMGRELAARLEIVFTSLLASLLGTSERDAVLARSTVSVEDIDADCAVHSVIEGTDERIINKDSNFHNIGMNSSGPNDAIVNELLQSDHPKANSDLEDEDTVDGLRELLFIEKEWAKRREVGLLEEVFPLSF